MGALGPPTAQRAERGAGAGAAQRMEAGATALAQEMTGAGWGGAGKRLRMRSELNAEAAGSIQASFRRERRVTMKSDLWLMQLEEGDRAREQVPATVSMPSLGC